MGEVRPCKTGLRPSPSPVILYYRSFQCDASGVVLPVFVLCFGVEFLCRSNLLYVFLVLVQFAFREVAAHSAYDMFSKYTRKYLIVNLVLLTSFLEWEFLTDCAFS